MRIRWVAASTARRSTRRGHGDSGSSALEAAVALPVALFLVFGAFGLVGALRDHATLADAVRSGGRTGAVAGSDPSADQLVLAKIARVAHDLGTAEVQAVVIWHASGPGASLPAGCALSGSGPNLSSLGVSDGGVDAVGACNVYLRPGAPGGAFAMATGQALKPASWYFGCQGATDPEASHKLDCRWPPKARRAATTARGAAVPAPPDFLGVHVVVDHRITSLASQPTIRLTEDVINLLEPTRYEV